MRAQVRLLETLVDYWDHELRIFDLQGEILELTIDDIYFIKELSRRGIPVNLERTGTSGDPMSMQDYTDTYFLPGTQRSGTCV